MNDIHEKILKALGSGQAPSERRAEKGKAAAAVGELPTLGSTVARVASVTQKARTERGKYDARLAKAKVPSLDDIERLTAPGKAPLYNVSLPQPKIRSKHIDTNVVQAGLGPSKPTYSGEVVGGKTLAPPREKGENDVPEVRPDVPELTGGAKLTKGEVGPSGGEQARTSYRVPPKKPPKDRRVIPNVGLSPTKNWKWKDSALGKAHADRTADDLIPGRSPSGTSGVGSKPSQHPNFSTAGTPRANQPPTQSSSQGLAIRGAVGREGSQKRDIKNRNIDAPEKPMPEGFTKEVFDFLEAKLHVDWETKAKTGGIFRFDPSKSTFEPLKSKNPLPPGASPAEKEKAVTDVEAASARMGIIGGKRVTPSTRPTNKADASKQLFGEDTMNPDKIANDIIREAFTSGDRNNTTPDSNGLDDKGGTARQMLAGEWFGSVAWPFDQPSNSDFAKSNQLQADQSVSGQGELVTGGAMESVGTEIVDSLLEDSPSSIYSDPQSVGYLINELQESGYAEQAAAIEAICENAKEEDVVKVVEMIDALEAAKADPFLIEQLAMFANLLIEEDETAKEEVPTGEDNKDEIEASNTGGSGL